MHSHAPGQVLDDNVITRNRISGNGTDGDLGPSLPAMGISISSAVVPVKGIVISQNVFKGEGMDIALNVSNGASAITAHFNSFFGEIGAPEARAPTVARRPREATSRPIPGSRARSKAREAC